MEGFSDSDLVMAHVYGFRSWRRDKDTNDLVPITGGTGYDVHNNVATCFRRHDRVPEAACGCGIWAYWSLPAAGPPYVRGVIAASGRILLGTKGFRAERADIVALLVPWWRPQLRQSLNERYGNVPFFSSSRRMIRQHHPDIEELVPEAVAGVVPFPLPASIALWVAVINVRLALDLVGIHVRSVGLGLLLIPLVAGGVGGFALGRRLSGRPLLPLRAHRWWRLLKRKAGHVGGRIVGGIWRRATRRAQRRSGAPTT